MFHNLRHFKTIMEAFQALNLKAFSFLAIDHKPSTPQTNHFPAAIWFPTLCGSAPFAPHWVTSEKWEKSNLIIPSYSAIIFEYLKVIHEKLMSAVTKSGKTTQLLQKKAGKVILKEQRSQKEVIWGVGLTGPHIG